MKDNYEGFAKSISEEYDGLISDGWEDYISDERTDI